MRQKYLRPRQAAKYIGIPTSTLAKRRLRVEPPQFIKIGASVFYSVQVLDEMMTACRRRSTSDAGNAAA